MVTRYVGLAMLTVVPWLAGCRSVSTSTEPQAMLSGSWAGEVIDEEAGSGSLRLAISQTGAGVSGSWTTTFANAESSRSGSLSGSITGAAVSLFLTPSSPLTCSNGTLSGTRSLTGTIAGNNLTGRYVGLTCSGAAGGSIDVRRVE